MLQGYSSHSVCLFICLSITKLAATHLVCESKVRYYKIPYDVPNTCMKCVDFALFASLASFADSKLLNFSWASDSKILRVNTTLSVARYIRYMYVLLTLGTCALGTIAKIINNGSPLPPSSLCIDICPVHWWTFNHLGWLWLLVNSKFSCMPCQVHSCGSYNNILLISS